MPAVCRKTCGIIPKAEEGEHDERFTVPGRRLPAVPTTKVLAVGRLHTPLTPEQRKTVMPREAADTVRLFLAGKVDRWWACQDAKGPVFLMNTASQRWT